jgi:hypothetical protein
MQYDDVLTVPVEKQERKRAHNEKKQNPDTKTCIVLDCLSKMKKNFKCSVFIVINK